MLVCLLAAASATRLFLPLQQPAAPQLDANVFEANGLFGVSQIDCAGGLGEGNTFRGNGKGAVFGECDREPA